MTREEKVMCEVCEEMGIELVTQDPNDPCICTIAGRKIHTKEEAMFIFQGGTLEEMNERFPEPISTN